MPGSPKSGNDERRGQPQAYYGIIYPQASIMGARNNQVCVRGMVYLTSFQVPQAMTIQKIFQTTNNQSGTTRFAIYDDNENTPQGGDKLLDTGNMGTGGGGRTSATLAYIATPGTYWMAVTFSTNLVQFHRSDGIAWTDFISATFSYRA